MTNTPKAYPCTLPSTPKYSSWLNFNLKMINDGVSRTSNKQLYPTYSIIKLKESMSILNS